MPSQRLHASLAAGLTLLTAAGALGVAAAPSGAATRLLPADINANPRAGALKYGTATLTLSGGAASKLSGAGGKLTGTGTAKVKGKKITFDAAESSRIDPTTMRGTLILEGGLTVKGRSKTTKLRSITLEPGIEKRVTAKLGSKLIELGSLKGGSLKFAGQADGTLSGAKLTLSSGGAKKLNAATGGGFAAGAFATVAAEATTRELPLRAGTATMTIDAGLLKTLTDNGYAITAEAPATVNGAVVTIPLTAGAFDPIDLSGHLSLEGKVTIGKPDSGITLFGWRAAIGGGQNDLYANFNSSAAAALATVDVTTLEITLDGKNFKGIGGKLALSKVATDVLKQQFGVTMAPGTPMGVVDLTGQLFGE